MNRITTLTAALSLVAGAALAQDQVPGEHFIENWDMNGDGAVTAEEATERRGDVFLSFDSNEDGFIDAEEYKLFDEARANDMKEMGYGQGQGQQGKGQGMGQGQGQNGKGMGQGGLPGQAAYGMSLEVNDLDKDGKVSREEFISQAPNWIAGMDRNGDGQVTSADFGPQN